MGATQFGKLLPVLFKRLAHWVYRFVVIGGTLSDPLHLDTLQLCDRLVLCLTPDPLALARADTVVPGLLQLTGRAADNVDVLLLQANQGLFSPENPDEAKREAKQQAYERALQSRVRLVHNYLGRWGLKHANLIGQIPDVVPLLEKLQPSCWSERKRPTLLHHIEGRQSAYGQAVLEVARKWVGSPVPSEGKTERRR